MAGERDLLRIVRGDVISGLVFGRVGEYLGLVDAG